MKTKEHFIRTPQGRIHTTDTPEFWKDAEKLPNKAGREAYREQAKSDLREWIKPGDRVYCCLRHVAKSGMSRRISLHLIKDGELRNITYTAAVAMDRAMHRDDHALIVGGCGMDMGWHLVYCLGSTLWPKGTPEPHGRRNGKPDSDGGYALKQEWI